MTDRRRSTRPVRLPAVAGLLALLALPACGGGSSSTTTTPLPKVPASEYVDQTGKAEVTILAVDNSFRTQYTKVSPGTKVVFENKGRNPHNVIAVNEGQFTDIPTDQLQAGDSGSITVPDTPGEVPYYCSLHGTPRAGMTGRLLVVADK
ncbi:MAG: plastocyanin/azurin family copper-binding protein [Actinomycetes bacterium]